MDAAQECFGLRFFKQRSTPVDHVTFVEKTGDDSPFKSVATSRDWSAPAFVHHWAKSGGPPDFVLAGTVKGTVRPAGGCADGAGKAVCMAKGVPRLRIFKRGGPDAQTAALYSEVEGDANPLRRVFPIHAITATGEEADAATGAELPLDALWPSSDDDPFGSCEEMVPSQRLNDDFDSMNGNPEMCPGGHGLEYARTNTVGVTWCDVCQERLPLESDAHGCAECDWHVCHACWQTCQDEKPPASRTRGRSARRPDATNTPPVHEGMQSGNSESGSDLDEPG